VIGVELLDPVVRCDNSFSRRSAPNPIYVGDLVFCSLECQARWINSGHAGMT
jgi:hypothetical protein